MADGTKIEWTDATLNVVNGCSVISPGCTNCYAMRSGGRNLPGQPSTGLTMPTKAGHVWTGEVRIKDTALMQPLRWKRPRRIFWNAHGDLFHENVPDAWIDRCFAVMALTPQHTHQVLTKRSARMRAYLTTQAWALRISDIVNAWPESDVRNGNEYVADCRLLFGGPLPNVWLGVSVEDQTRADERVPDLLATPAAVRWISAEPLLEPLDLSRWLDGWPTDGFGPTIDWLVVGGESGPGARPMHPDWARSLRDQCANAGVPFLFKQWGEWAPVVTTGHNDPRYGVDPPTGEHLDRVGKRAAGRLLDGVQHDGYPT